MIAPKLYFLSKVDLFSDLTTQELTELAGKFQWEEYDRDTHIVVQGQENHRFFVLTSGKAVSLVSKQGRASVQLAEIGPGSYFGEKSLVSGKPVSASVRCLERCTLLTLDTEDFARMLVRWPKLYKRFAERLSVQLSEANIGIWESKQKEFLHTALQTKTFEEKFYGLWGSRKTTKEVENKLAELAKNRAHLLLMGERGAGRQMFAWYLHKQAFGEAAPFVIVEGDRFDRQWGDLVFESRSADEDPAEGAGGSLLDIAAGGTLLIREIDLLSPIAQLRLAESMRRRPEAYVIGTSIGRPERLIPELKGCFTQSFTLTPLRDRKRDIPVIAQAILEKLAEKHNRNAPAIDQEAMKLLLHYNYRHGNVSELIQVVERAFYLAEQDVIGLEHVFYGPTAEKGGPTFNLLTWKWLNRLLKNGAPVLWLRRITALAFYLILFTMIIAPHSRLSDVFMAVSWGIWWPVLAIVSPSLGRVWCTICPFGFTMGEIQKKFHLNRPVPDLLKKYNYLFITFLFLLIMWTELINEMHLKPFLTALLVLGVVGLAGLIGILYQRHAWCHYLCPLGAFVGMASIGSMIEIRSDTAVCLNKCTTFDCYRGTAEVPGCPMSQHAPYIDNNMDCKLCFNCVRNCPNGAIKLNLRVPAREVWHLVRVNQGFVIFIGVALAILLPITWFPSPEHLGSQYNWRLWFTIAYWGTALAAGGLTWLIARPFKTKVASQRIKLVFACIPLVLAGYIGYELRFLPGTGSLLLGFGVQPAFGQAHTYLVPALSVAQWLSGMIGLLLSGSAAVMVYIYGKKSAG